MIDPALQHSLPPAQIQIGDEFFDTGTAGSYDHINPATGKVQASIPLGGKSEIDQAVTTAKTAFATWRAMHPSQRRNHLMKLAALITENSDELIRLSCLENGTSLKSAFVQPMIAEAWTSYYAGWADKIDGQVTSSIPSDQFAYTLPEPYGVIGIIITWNGPLISLGMKVAPALAAGNTVVIKPSEMTPFAVGLFGKLALEAGIPPGVINIVPGGAEAGEALVTHPEVEKISFTGGPISARKIQISAAQTLKPLIFELGGKSASIVFPDADLSRVCDQAVTFSIGMMSGQGCAFPTRLLVHKSIYEEVIERIVKRTGELVVGSPLDPNTDVGPVVNEAAYKRILNMIERAKENGEGRLVAGGTPVAGEPEGGFFITPTVFADVSPDSHLAQEEIFGPVLCITPFADEEEAIAIANSTDYGLASYIQTSNLGRANRMSSALRAGNVYINGAMPIQPVSPFGGERLSGHGREGGRAGLDEFLRLKTVATANAIA